LKEAQKFARHARRAYLTPEDVNLALRLRNVEPIYGLSSSSDPARFVRAAGFEDVYYAQDPVLSIETLLETPLPPVPWEAGIRIHWLAVDGVQPSIPENAPLQPAHHRDKRRKTEAERPVPPVPMPPPPFAPGGQQHQPPSAAAHAGAIGGGGAAEEGALVRAPVKHVLSRELHMYYEKAAAVLGASNATPGSQDEGAPHPLPIAYAPDASPACRALLSSLRVDAGMQPLAPYLCQLVSDQVAASLGDAGRLEMLLRAAAALAANPNLDLGPYLHMLVPAVLTCLLARHVATATRPTGARPGSSAGINTSTAPETASLAPEAPHWTIREHAARATACICKNYPDAAPRIQRQLVAGLAAPGAPLQTIFGAVCGIYAQGPRVVKALLLPNLLPCMHALQEDLQGRRGAARSGAALRVRAALLAAAGHCVYLSGVCASWGSEGGGNRGVYADKHGGGGGGGAHRVLFGSGSQKPRRGTDTPSQATRSHPRLAKVTAADVDTGCLTVVSANDAASHPAIKKQQKRKEGSRGAKLAAGGISNHRVGDVDQFFETMDGEGSDMDVELAEAAAEALDKVPAEVMHAADPEGRLGRGAVEGAAWPRLPDKNELAEAWREDFPPLELRRVMVLVFGDDVAPYERDAGGNGGCRASHYAAFL
jgi:hypothetical protein